jgi:lipoprotein-releasing system ATP-binding protein
MSHIFDIQNASFSYDQSEKNAVLHVENLQIPSGKIVFLLGASGSGKSTILEALGLMNNTIAKGNVQFNGSEGKNTNLSDIWLDKTKLYNLRKRSFSFIFQNTNLMEDFTAYENISLSKMIKEGASQAKATTRARDLMYDVGLPDNLVGIEKQSSQLSGGQRQRLSFVRALSSNFDVLFCDEPTGNLDPINARELFEVIKNAIGASYKSAIVVSHDVDLALEYADVIIGIAKDERGKGFINQSNVYNLEENDKTTVRKKILDLYHTDRKVVEAVEKKEISLHKSLEGRFFGNLFRLREGKSLSGKKWRNLSILMAIFCVTFLALGFSNGSFRYLEEKMDNPFVQWIVISIPFDQSDDAMRILKDKIGSPEMRESYSIKNMASFRINYLYFKGEENGRKTKISAMARTFEYDGKILDPILGDLLSEKNVIRARTSFSGKSDLGIIVTDKFIRELGIKEKFPLFLPYVNTVKEIESGLIKDTTVLLPIKAIVKEIPGKIDVGFTQGFYENYIESEAGSFNPSVYNSLNFHVVGEKSEALKALKVLKTKMKSNASVEVKFASIKPYKYSYAGGYMIGFSFISTLDGQVKKSIQKDLETEFSQTLPSITITPVLDFDQHYKFKNNYTKGDYISLNFKELSSIEKFDDWLRKQNEGSKDRTLSIDTSRVREKKNFLFLSQILTIISAILVFFAAISISIFITNLLRMHLDKVKMNIGTFMAFGLSGKKVQYIYFQIICLFIATALIGGLIIASLVGLGLESFLANQFIEEEGISFFKILDIKTAYILLVILLIAIGMSWRTISKMLAKTPGDLIYNR